MTMKMKNYTDLSKLKTYKERLEYLQLKGTVGIDTFGFDRYLNQALYTSRKWKSVRDKVIVRDNGCDLGIEGYEIFSKPIIHHMNPITQEQIEKRDPIIFDPEFLITVTHQTHNAIHYGTEVSDRCPIERTEGDTTLWRKRNG